MRNAFWLTLIVGALVAIVAGFVQGTLQTQPPPVAQLRQTTLRNVPAVAPGSIREDQGSIQDTFARDDVVVERRRPSESQWQPQRLNVVVGSCGHSIAAESGFLGLNAPIAFVVDPSAPQAAAFAQLVRANGDVLFVQLDDPPAAQVLATLRRALGVFDGVASRNASGMPVALHGTGLAFFDERGDAGNEMDFAASRVALVRRDVTADNRSGSGYVRFMLERAAALSRRAGPVVVFVRPLPTTLAALREFAASPDVRMIALQ